MSEAKTLPNDVKRILKALVLVVVPVHSELQINDMEHGMERGMTQILNEFTGFFRWGFLMGLRFFEWSPLLFGYGFIRFSSLSLQKQEKYVESWANSRLIFKREFFKAASGLAKVVFFSMKEVWNYIGYHPEPHMKERIELRERLLKEKMVDTGI